MIKCNLKYRDGKTGSDLRIAFGKGCTNTLGNSKKVMEQTANEIDKVLAIRDWGIAVGNHKF